MHKEPICSSKCLMVVVEEAWVPGEFLTLWRCSQEPQGDITLPCPGDEQHSWGSQSQPLGSRPIFPLNSVDPLAVQANISAYIPLASIFPKHLLLMLITSHCLPDYLFSEPPSQLPFQSLSSYPQKGSFRKPGGLGKGSLGFQMRVWVPGPPWLSLC